jgi:hypothetical protein
MRPQAFDTVQIISPADSLPFRSLQISHKWPAIMRLGVLGVLAVAVVGPQLAILFTALGNADVRALAAARPFVGLGLAVSLTFWVALFALPISRLVHNLNGRRSVVIGRGAVDVLDENAAGTRVWTAPLASYSGIAHRVRTSLSGARHELMLVHPKRERCVLLMVGEHISESDIGRFSQLLNVPQIAPRQPFLSVGSGTRAIPVSAVPQMPPQALAA